MSSPSHYLSPLLFVFYCFILISCDNPQPKPNPRPVIGVFAQPSDFPNQYPTNEFSYIAASYIKFIESSGARAIPIPYDLPQEQLKYLFNGINGLIFPGGDALLWDNEDTHTKMSEMTLAGQYLIRLAIEANDNGDYFPIWGTCLGYELMIMAITNDKDILDRFVSKNHVLKVKYTEREETRLFRNIDDSLINYTENVDTLYFNHNYGITPEHFLTNPVLNETFFISSVANTDNGTYFVSSIEGIKYPFYGVQFHPEKNSFEWRKSINASHTPQAVKISQELGNFFINETRKNFHSFGSEEETDNLTIYNFNPVKVNRTFMECYFFPKARNHI